MNALVCRGALRSSARSAAPLFTTRTFVCSSRPLRLGSLAPAPFPAFAATRAFSRTWPARSTPTSGALPPKPPAPTPAPVPANEAAAADAPAVHENIYTLPNALTLSRIAACPVIGWAILHDEFYLSTGLLVYAGLSDWVDGFIARRYDMRSVLGTILDPAADKTLMTTLVVTLAMKGLLPVPLAALILGRDVALSLSAFYIRYTSLPAPKTFARYWDFSIPSAEVRPTQISKYNTALQLLLMLTTAVVPIVPHDLSTGLTGLQWVVAGTTLWSGLSYLFTKGAVRIVARPPGKTPPRTP